MTDNHMTDFGRFGRITASVVPDILRSGKRSRKYAWRVITGREPYVEAGYDVQRGLDHEDDAIAAAEAQLCALALPGRFVAHPDIDWLGASPDGFITEVEDVGGAILYRQIPIEAKCPRVLHAEVPQMYYDQIQTQIECCNSTHAYFVSWTENGQWVKKVLRDLEWWERNYSVLKEFYYEYVLKDIEPPRSARRKKNGEQQDVAGAPEDEGTDSAG